MGSLLLWPCAAGGEQQGQTPGGSGMCIAQTEPKVFLDTFTFLQSALFLPSHLRNKYWEYAGRVILDRILQTYKVVS